jgi:hypothetical protein
MSSLRLIYTTQYERETGLATSVPLQATRSMTYQLFESAQPAQQTLTKIPNQGQRIISLGTRRLLDIGPYPPLSTSLGLDGPMVVRWGYGPIPSNLRVSKEMMCCP